MTKAPPETRTGPTRMQECGSRAREEVRSSHPQRDTANTAPTTAAPVTLRPTSGACHYPRTGEGPAGIPPGGASLLITQPQYPRVATSVISTDIFVPDEAV